MFVGCFKQISTPSFVETLIQIYGKPENNHHSACIEVIEAVVLKVIITIGLNMFNVYKVGQWV